MKKIIIACITLAALMISISSSAQQINWRNITNDKPHLANVNLAWDYGTVAAIGYGQKLRTKLPIVVNIEYSSAIGKQIFDDFKTKLGGQAEVVNVKGFSVAVKAYGVFRRYQNDLVRLAGFGSEFSTTIGYYKTRWYAAGEFGFDKAITTNIKHSKEMKTLYPGIQSGWYIPTGGNFFYGIVSGYSFKTNDVYVKAGRTVTQDFKTAPTVPFYLQVGYNKRF